MDEISFRDKPPPDLIFHQVSLQNSHLWIFTAKEKLLVKKELNDNGEVVKSDNDYNIVDDSEGLSKAKITKMVVDESGYHCFLISDNIIFYNHWLSGKIHRIPKEERMIFTSLAFQVINENTFEILIGTESGHILHAVLES